MIRTRRSVFWLIPILCVAAVQADAAILSVDFDSGSPTETGFSSQPDANRTFGAYTVTTSSNSFFTRPGLADSGAFTYADLYRDFNYLNPAGSSINYTVSGLEASTAYSLRVYAYDFGEPGGTVTVAPTGGSGTTGLGGSINWVGGGVAPATNDQYSALLVLTTDSSGVLSFTAGSATANTLRVNGFVIDEVVPEPASLGLLLAGGLLALARRRPA